MFEQKNRSVFENSVRVLAVDNDANSLLVIETTLLALGYQVVLAHDEDEAFIKAREDPDLILLGSHMPVSRWSGLVRSLKMDGTTGAVPIVLTTAAHGRENCFTALTAGVDDFVTEPLDKIELSITVSSLLVVSQAGQLPRYRNEIRAEVTRRSELPNASYINTSALSLKRIYCLSRVAEFRDEEAHGHIERISHYSTAIARKLGLDDAFQQNILFAAPLHDVGEITIPDAVLQKAGKLNEKEWEIMRRHSPFGAELLQRFEASFLEMAKDIASTHHERWNGTGYPRGLKETEIPLAGRVVAIADVFDVLTWERPYKQPVPLEEAFAIIREGRGTHFDPYVVDAFFGIQDEITLEFNWWKFLGQ